MISREPTLERLATAQSLLLAPFGLNESHLTRALAQITAHRVDDADLYFQYTRSEGWSLEEGIVKTGSFSIDQGVGVRAVAGEKTAFAYSDDISEASLMDAALTVRSIAASVSDMGQAASYSRLMLRMSLLAHVHGAADPTVVPSAATIWKVVGLLRIAAPMRLADADVSRMEADPRLTYVVVLNTEATGSVNV